MKEISCEEHNINPISSVGEGWWLICAGNEERGCNGMTASWGHLGSIWGLPGRNPLPTVTVYIRPQRYTHDFVDREEYFTVCSFSPEYKKALAYFGTKSGRDGDKFAATGLTPVFSDGTVYPAEAETVFICRKIYKAPILESGFVDRRIVDFDYPEKDFHDMYVGEIVRTLVRD